MNYKSVRERHTGSHTIVPFILFYRHNGALVFIRATSIHELAEIGSRKIRC